MRRALVTGVGRGIGNAVVTHLLNDGFDVAGTLRRSGDHSPVWDRPVHLEIADAKDAELTERAVQAAAVALGGLDAIVANAGRGMPGKVLDATPDQWIDQLFNKVLTVTNLVSAALPILRESDSPSIVVVGGVTALRPERDQGVVSAMRAAQMNLVANLAAELASDGIRVNSVLLGAITTDRQYDRFANSGHEDFDSWVSTEVQRRAIPFGRFGTADEVAELIAFLCSNRAAYMTGAQIPVSGGMGT